MTSILARARGFFRRVFRKYNRFQLLAMADEYTAHLEWTNPDLAVEAMECLAVQEHPCGSTEGFLVHFFPNLDRIYNICYWVIDGQAVHYTEIPDYSVTYKPARTIIDPIIKSYLQRRRQHPVHRLLDRYSKLAMPGVYTFACRPDDDGGCGIGETVEIHSDKSHSERYGVVFGFWPRGLPPDGYKGDYSGYPFHSDIDTTPQDFKDLLAMHLYLRFKEMRVPASL